MSPPTQKVATLGQFAAGVARMEFLLGTMYHQGTTAKWETGNTGVFPDTYDAAIGGGAQPWCTKFAGYAYTRLGFKANKKGTTSEFMSGYRLRDWSTEGKGVDGKEITAADQTADDAVDTGSTLIDKDEWKQLRKDLKKAKTAEERTAATAAFFADGAHPLPQAGDIVVKPRGDAEGTNEFTAGKSHTMLVESYDAASSRSTRSRATSATRSAGARSISPTPSTSQDHLPHPDGHAVLRQRPDRGGRRGRDREVDLGPRPTGRFGGGLSATPSRPSPRPC